MSATDKTRVKRRTALRSLGAAGLVGLAGCAGGGDGDDGSDGGGSDGGGSDSGGSDGSGTRTDSGPQLEDELTIYAPTNISPVARAFEERFGTTVNDTVYAGPQSHAKFVSEASSGEYNADILITAGGYLIWPSTRQYLAEIDIEDNEKVWNEDRRGLFEEIGGIGYGWPWATLIRGTPYNTNAVEDPPVTWDDFLDSKWEDSFITPPYNTGRGYSALLLEGWDEDRARQYMEDLRPNIASFQPGVPGNIQQIIGGQADVGFQLMAFFAREGLQGQAPIDITFPEFTTEHIEGIVVSKEASSPNAARKFVEWIISDEGQEAVQQDLGFNPAHVDMAHGTPEIDERLEEYDPTIHPLMYTSEEQANEIDSLMDEIYNI